MNTSVIRAAIANRNLVEFTYRGYLRIAEPHVYGIKDGKRQILVYQIGGLTSTGRVPDWRLIGLEEISGLKVLKGETFEGPRKHEISDYDHWDAVVAAVR